MVATGSAVHALSAIRHWVFDMDGTLTVAVHDFAAIRRALEIAAEEDILEEAIGVGALFDDADIIGRDEAVPKPSPEGLQQHLRRWGIGPAQAVMVGDHAYDLECGRAAGTHTVLVNLPENPWPGRADWHFADCRALLAAWQAA